MKYALALVVLLLFSISALAQQTDAAKSSGNGSTASSTIPPAPAITDKSSPAELAAAALAAQGGEKFKSLKSMWIMGDANLYAPNSSQSIPGKFSMVTVGDKIRIDINAQPVFLFKQIYDGQQSYSSIPGVSMPPANKFGLMVLTKFDQPGYTVSALPNDKKLRGFRIVDGEGNTTDFFIDSATARVMKYLIPYNGYMFGTENAKFKEVDGVLVPMSFTQRLEMPQGAFFAEYKVKDVKLNTPIGNDVFAIQ
ncbi:MAG TPA: hypothetical protein VNG71_19775 [Pyrinomonadaceae bacterium]|nr:hypothetical protein [Pyrinomonadaceae bacterium]